jgi:hypothetical protein
MAPASTKEYYMYYEKCIIGNIIRFCLI